MYKYLFVELKMYSEQAGQIKKLSSKAKRQAARLAQLGERRSAEREAVGSNPGRTNTQGL